MNQEKPEIAISPDICFNVYNMIIGLYFSAYDGHNHGAAMIMSVHT